MSRIFVAPLSWGLGHATRVTPLIREFIRRGHDVTIGSSGAARSFLQQEFPSCENIDFPDYPHNYSSGRFFIPKFTLGLGSLFRALREERRFAEGLFGWRKFDLILSDNRFGVWHRDTPSFFLSHQIRYAFQWYLRFMEPASMVFNGSFHRNFQKVIIPDNPPGCVSLSGRLALSWLPITTRRIFWSGILSSIIPVKEKEDLDYLACISGPEPQRTRLEAILLPKLARMRGRKIVLLGKPSEHGKVVKDNNMEIYSHVGRMEMAKLMGRAKFIISRPGYTTMMELAELGKRRALLIPTPGQPEQTYLSRYYERRGWFHSRSQYGLDLEAGIREAASFKGFPAVPGTEANVRRLFGDVFDPALRAERGAGKRGTRTDIRLTLGVAR